MIGPNKKARPTDRMGRAKCLTAETMEQRNR